jgi:hypothetical protein
MWRWSLGDHGFHSVDPHTHEDRRPHAGQSVLPQCQDSRLRGILQRLRDHGCARVLRWRDLLACSCFLACFAQDATTQTASCVHPPRTDSVLPAFDCTQALFPSWSCVWGYSATCTRCYERYRLNSAGVCLELTAPACAAGICYLTTEYSPQFPPGCRVCARVPPFASVFPLVCRQPTLLVFFSCCGCWGIGICDQSVLGSNAPGLQRGPIWQRRLRQWLAVFVPVHRMPGKPLLSGSFHLKACFLVRRLFVFLFQGGMVGYYQFASPVCECPAGGVSPPGSSSLSQCTFSMQTRSALPCRVSWRSFFLIASVPVDGGWGLWSECNAGCAGGTRSRTCSNPAPQRGGRNCTGPLTQACNTEPCLPGFRFPPPHVGRVARANLLCPSDGPVSGNSGGFPVLAVVGVGGGVLLVGAAVGWLWYVVSLCALLVLTEDHVLDAVGVDASPSARLTRATSSIWQRRVVKWRSTPKGGWSCCWQGRGKVGRSSWRGRTVGKSNSCARLLNQQLFRDIQQFNHATRQKDEKTTRENECIKVQATRDPSNVPWVASTVLRLAGAP